MKDINRIFESYVDFNIDGEKKTQMLKYMLEKGYNDSKSKEYLGELITEDKRFSRFCAYCFTKFSVSSVEFSFKLYMYKVISGLYSNQ